MRPSRPEHRSDGFIDFVHEQLLPMAAVTSRAMFGGHGLYSEDCFFAIVYAGRLYFRTDEESRQDFIELGMEPFRPSPTQILKHYYEVPVDILESSERLVAWAEQAVAAQRRTQARRRGGRDRGA